METTKLIAFLKKAKQVKNKTDIPICDYILIKDQEMNVTNLDIFYKMYFSELDMKCICLIPFDYLYKIATKVNKGKINLNISGEIITEKGTFKYDISDMNVANANDGKLKREYMGS